MIKLGMLHGEDIDKVKGTTRIEALSDGFFSIVMTILILEVHKPYLATDSLGGVLTALQSIAPQLFAFAFSFVTLAIFWVNHHHFYHPITHTDWPLLWHNCHLLFWMSVIPFTTAFLGDNPFVPAVIALYGFVLGMGALAFRMMSTHAYFHSNLIENGISIPQRKSRNGRALFGVVAYWSAIPLAFISPWLAWFALVVVPLFYFVPQVLKIEEGHA